jgi:hypothetical protein
MSREAGRILAHYLNPRTLARIMDHNIQAKKKNSAF